jgi:hypothetical protein
VFTNYFSRGSAPPWCTLSSAVLHGLRPPQPSCTPIGSLVRAVFQEKLVQNMLFKIPYKFKNRMAVLWNRRPPRVHPGCTDPLLSYLLDEYLASARITHACISILSMHFKSALGLPEIFVNPLYNSLIQNEALWELHKGRSWLMKFHQLGIFDDPSYYGICITQDYWKIQT